MPAHKKTQPIKTCRVCSSEFSKPPHLGLKSWALRECCSKICGATHKGFDDSYRPLVKTCENKFCREYFTKAKNDTHEHFLTQKYCSISCAKVGKRTGEENNKWLGDEVGYSGVHLWIRRAYGRPQFCEHCRTSARRMYHWANRTGKYLRDREDWLRLCVPCHRKYDNEQRLLKSPLV